MDLVDRYRVRRHLSASSSRGEGKIPPGLKPARARYRRASTRVRHTKAHKKTGPAGPVFSSLECVAASIVAAIVAMVVMVMVVVVAEAGRHHDDAPPVGVMMMMVVMGVSSAAEIGLGQLDVW